MNVSLFLVCITEESAGNDAQQSNDEDLKYLAKLLGKFYCLPLRECMALAIKHNWDFDRCEDEAHAKRAAYRRVRMN